MENRPIVPCIWLHNQAEDAAAFYVRALPAGRVTAVSHYPESLENPSGLPRGSVLTVEFEAGGLRFTALNGGPEFRPNPSVSFFVFVEAPERAERLFGALGEGGQALMPLDAYPWSERYGWVQDRFGVSWQVMTARRPQGAAAMVPCLMFAGAQHGRAEEALRTYSSLFPGGRIDSIERYSEGEGPSGTVKHGRCVLAGQELIAMDSHVAHGFTFNEGLSLQAMCESQEEVDRYWEALSDGGEKGPCGWLKDRFGVSWQVVPTQLMGWIKSKNLAGRDRAFQAMLGMKKLDIAALGRAFEGRSPG